VAVIELDGVTKRFGNKVAVNNLSLGMEEGTITMLIGPSGCGKTTTMKMINRLVAHDAGVIRVKGVSVRDLDPVQLRRSIGYVIQEIGLFPHLTVFENVAVVPRLLKWEETRIRERVAELLDLVTLDESFTQKYPLELSGGERQRVGLARALAAEPDILLMDEPFGAIDPINRLRLQDSFLEIQEEIKKTIVFVTHDINEAIKLGDRIAIMHQGNLVQYDAAGAILANPANEFVANLLGKDRSLKALALEKTRSLVKSDGYATVHIDEAEPVVLRKIQEEDVRIVFALDDGRRLKGRYRYQMDKKTRRHRLIFDPDPVSVDRNTNLNEALAMMLEAGERQLPVVDRRGTFVGMVELTDIFDEVEVETPVGSA
jgi:osmoprotectant transport system ATP-binding protein